MTMDQAAGVTEVPVHAPQRAIDITNSSDLRDSMLVDIESGAKVVITDLSSVRYVDSSGLSALVNVATTIEKHQGQVILCSVDKSVLKVLEMTRLTDYFVIVYDLDEAMARAGELTQA